MTPLTGVDVDIYYSKVQCGSYDEFNRVSLDQDTGTYTVTELLAGTYYLYVKARNANYLTGWWTQNSSATECQGAEPIVIAAEEAITNK